jgi:hypothetical protein
MPTVFLLVENTPPPLKPVKLLAWVLFLLQPVIAALLLLLHLPLPLLLLVLSLPHLVPGVLPLLLVHKPLQQLLLLYLPRIQPVLLDHLLRCCHRPDLLPLGSTIKLIT